MSDIKIGVKYARLGLTRFIGHLDMQRLVGRALRRSGMPVAYSEGFNPHVVLSFASALGVGVETMGDYFEFKLTEQVDKISIVLPEGFKVYSAGVLTGGKLMASTGFADYSIVESSGDLWKTIMELFSMEQCIADKKGKPVDIRPLMLEAEAGRVRLALSPKESLSPMLLVKRAFEHAGKEFDFRVIRREIYDLQGVPLEKLWTPMELA